MSTPTQSWGVSTVGEQFDVQLGKMLDAARNVGQLKPYLGNRAVQWNRIDVSAAGIVPMTSSDLRRYRLRRGDLLVCEGGDVGRAAIWCDEIPECYYQKALHRLRPKRGYDARLMLALLERWSSIGGFANYVTQTSIAHLPRDKFIQMPLPLPELSEQQRLGDLIDDLAAQIRTLERLIAKKQAIKQGMMQHLLTGAVRLPGFELPWKTHKIAELLQPRTERNIEAEPLTVLTCTKHFGFVRSLEFFKNQVFSRDLSNYRLIYRGDIGYPANHVEEGSIGVQELEDRALVSPIYVVMEPFPKVDSYFLQRLLKLETYRQRFSKVTNASVDRRGSLRWPEFSRIEVSIPDIREQRCISSVLRTAEQEIGLLEQKITKAKHLKRGMMQELLTGRTRLPVEVVAS